MDIIFLYKFVSLQVVWGSISIQPVNIQLRFLWHLWIPYLRLQFHSMPIWNIQILFYYFSFNVVLDLLNYGIFCKPILLYCAEHCDNLNKWYSRSIIFYFWIYTSVFLISIASAQEILVSFGKYILSLVITAQPTSFFIVTSV